MPKVALIRVVTKWSYNYDEDVKNQIAEHISDWTDISQNDFEILKNNAYKDGYQVIEFPDNQENIIRETVQQAVERLKREALKRKQQQEKYEREKDQKALERKRKQFEKLKKELDKS